MDLSFLKQIVPTIATALGGPLAGVAAGFIADKLGVSDKTISNVSDAITKATQSPETLLELKRIDAELQKYFAGLEIDIFKLEVADRADARNREIQLKDWVPSVLGISIVAGFFFTLAWLAFNGLPPGNENAFMFLLGSLATMTQSVMSYYFGSTKGSADKTAVMAATVTSSKG